MRVTRPGLALGSAMIPGLLVAGVADAQSASRKAPRINLNTALGGAVATNYIEPSVTLSEDAYVFVISVDVDRNIQILHPTDIDLSIKMVAKRQLQLPRFFAGFGGGDLYSTRSGMGYASYDAYGSGYSDTRGTMIALASRTPFNLAAISSGGDWDLVSLRRLVDDREPYAAASLLAKYLGAPGEPIGRDVHRFAGARHFYNTFYNNAAYYDCGLYSGALGYARGFRSGYAISFFRAAQLAEAGYVVRFRGYDACGQPRFDVYPTTLVGTPPGRPPAVGAFPAGRLPSTAPRNPTREQSASGRQVVGSRPTRGGYTDGDNAPAMPTRISEPRPVPERFHPQPVGGTVSERPRVSESNPAPRGGTIQSERPSPPRESPPPPPERMSVPRPIPERVSQPVYTPERTEPRHVPERSSPPPPPRSEPSVERVRPTPAPDPTPVDG